MSEKYIYTEHLSKTYRVGRGKHGIETKYFSTGKNDAWEIGQRAI